MADKKSTAIHFSDGTKIICGVVDGKIAEGGEVVTCGRCLHLLHKLLKNTGPTLPPVADDPNAICFSDGKKAICGKKDAKALKDEQKVTCKKCQFLLAQKAKAKGDPLINVRVMNQDLNDGVDFGFFFEGTLYKLINGAAHALPRSLIEHLKKLAYPFKRYEPKGESGRCMVVAGRRYRFAITELGD